jgi:fructose-1,6-bisphosphatase/inositol monophosphatase family enzyme
MQHFFPFLAPLNEHMIGVLMREVARRACAVIYPQRLNFTWKEKEVTYKSEIDVVTSADFDAQALYLEFLKKNFPKFGIIAEEDDLFTPAQPFTVFGNEPHQNVEHYFYFTIDPLDGTKAFKRGQSGNYSTMISLIHHCPELGIKEVVGVCIGDPMTNEMYYTRPGSPRVHQLDRVLDLGRILTFDATLPLKERYVLFRDETTEFSPIVQQLAGTTNKAARMFKSYQIEGGSIGISFAKLWKNEYAALVLKPGKTTAWDTAPVIGICNKLGYVPLVCRDNKLVLTSFEVPVERVETPQEETVVVHESLVPQILAWSDTLN